VFVKTVFSASEKFDSVPVKLMRGPCHLFVKRCLQLVRNVSGGFRQCLCFSPQSRQDCTSAKRHSGYPQTASRAGPLMCFIRQAVGNQRYGLRVGDCLSPPLSEHFLRTVCRARDRLAQ